MRIKYVEGSLTLPDRETCESVLNSLQAPVSDSNVEQLQEIIRVLGEVCNKAYDKMLRNIGNQKIAQYQVGCEECGAEYSLSLTRDDFPEPKHRC